MYIRVYITMSFNNFLLYYMWHVRRFIFSGKMSTPTRAHLLPGLRTTPTEEQNRGHRNAYGLLLHVYTPCITYPCTGKSPLVRSSHAVLHRHMYKYKSYTI
jgi:hypothetical protein